MIRLVRWLLPAGCSGFGIYALRLSYLDYAMWQEYLALGDPSGAELYEVNFWLELPAAVSLIFLGAFLAGRWSVRQS